MSDGKKEYFNVYLSQGGGNLTCVMERQDVGQLQKLLAEHDPFSVWMAQAGNRLSGIFLNAARGGLVLSISPAVRIPLRKDGLPANNQAEIEKWLEPWEQPLGQLKTYYPERRVAGPAVDAPVAPEEKPSEPPPGPA